MDGERVIHNKSLAHKTWRAGESEYKWGSMLLLYRVKETDVCSPPQIFRCVSISIRAKFSNKQPDKHTRTFVWLCMNLYNCVWVEYIWLCMTIVTTPTQSQLNLTSTLHNTTMNSTSSIFQLLLTDFNQTLTTTTITTKTTTSTTQTTPFHISLTKKNTTKSTT